MRAAHDRSFIGDGMSVLLVMQVEHLPDPLVLAWRKGYADRHVLHVQVRDRDFRVWLDQLRNPELHNETDDDGNHHVHAEGHLDDAPTALVHLVTVTREPLTALEA